VRGHSNLKWLFLNSTHVTDLGLAHLRGLTKFGWLLLMDNKVTDSGVAELKSLGCRI